MDEEQQWFMSDYEFKDKLSGYLNKVKNRKKDIFKIKDNISLTIFLLITGALLMTLITAGMLIIIPSILITIVILSPLIVLEVMTREIIKRREKINEDNSKGID